jgi:hypothetical protein
MSKFAFNFTTNYIQGRVLSIDVQDGTAKGMYGLNMDGMKHKILSIEFPNGAISDRLVTTKEDDNSIEVGHVLRAVDLKPNHSDSVINDIYRNPSLMHIVNLGNTAIDSKQRTHYEAGTNLSGVIIENTGYSPTLDWDFYFSRIRLDNGDEIEVTLPEGQIQEGTRITAKVGYSSHTPEKELFSLGFGNLAGMPLLCDVKEASPNVGNAQEAQAFKPKPGIFEKLGLRF